MHRIWWSMVVVVWLEAFGSIARQTFTNTSQSNFKSESIYESYFFHLFLLVLNDFFNFYGEEY